MGALSNSTDSDSQGRIWINARYGSARFDPATGKWQLFQQKTPANGTTYGVAADADDNGWWSQFYADLVVKADTKTGQVYELPMRDPQYEARKKLATPADLEFYASIGAQSWDPRANVLPYAAAPRRMAADKTGSTVWVPNWAGQNLAEIDIHTLKVTYHPLPIHGHPYSAAVDKQHNAWAVIPLGDSVVKLDPTTQRWTVYRLPSHGCGSRHFSIDDVRGEVWVPCDQSSRVARFQFRTARQILAQKKAAGASAARR
jgi:streptogramin lyase